MHTNKTWRHATGAIALALGCVASADATTMVRASLEDLTAAHETVVVGEVMGARSYWNAARSLIFTDVRVAPTEVLKGSAGAEITVTLLGGTVGDRTAMIVAGASLQTGRSYVLFLGRGTLPGAADALTPSYLSQGVFDLAEGTDGVTHAVSQAASHPLVADRFGRTDPAGGPDGLPLHELTQRILDAVRQGPAEEVQR